MRGFLYRNIQRTQSTNINIATESSIEYLHYHTIHINNDNGVIKEYEIGRRNNSQQLAIFSQ